MFVMDIDLNPTLLEPEVVLKNMGSVDSVDFSEALRNYVPDTAEERKLLRKIDLRLMPILWLMYILNYIDRTNIGNAKIAGMPRDLHLDDIRYSWSLTIFFIGYLIMEVPSNMIFSRSRPSLFLPAIMLIWGLLSAATASATSYGALLSFRFILGCIESGFFPGVVYLLSCWYKPVEAGKRFAIFFSASILSGSFGGFLAGAITGSMDGALGIAAWRWLFIIEGVATMCAAIGAKFVLLDFPSTSLSLNPRERQLATIRLVATGIEHGSYITDNTLTHWQAFKAAMCDYRTFLFLLLFITNVGAATIIYFIPTLLVVAGFKAVEAQFMTIPIYLFGTIVLNITAFSADRWQDRRWHIIIACSIGCLAAIVCIITQNAIVRYIMLCFVGSGIWSALPLILAWTSETINFPAEKRAICLATVNSLAQLGSMYASTMWPDDSAPVYVWGWTFTAISMGFGAVTAVLIPTVLERFPPYVTRAEKELRDMSRAVTIVDGGSEETVPLLRSS